MSVVLLANVGLRDVLHRGQEVKPPRTEGQKIKERFEELAPELSVPMLEPAVRELLSHHRRLQVVLYGTDQPEDTPEPHRIRDTVHLAEVAARLLERRLGREGVERCWAKRVEGNPSLYDDMLARFRAALSRGQPWTREVESCYVFPTGGTPAANTGLMLAAIERFGERCVVLYLPEGESRPVRLDVARQIRESMARQMAAERLRRRYFGAAIPLLEGSGASGWVAAVARYADHRYHFDFDLAAAALEEAKSECGGDPGLRDRCERLRRGLLRLRDRELPALLLELYHNAGAAHERGEFAAFLGLVFRFQEASLRHMAEELYPGLSTDVADGEGRDRFAAYIRGDPALLAGIERLLGRGWNADPTGPNRRVLAAIVQVGLERWQESPDGAGIRERFGRANERLSRLEGLAALRNRCPIGHGFEGVSEKKIRERYAAANGEGSPLEDMAGALTALGIEVGDSPFEEAAGLALQGLE